MIWHMFVMVDTYLQEVRQCDRSQCVLYCFGTSGLFFGNWLGRLLHGGTAVRHDTSLQALVRLGLSTNITPVGETLFTTNENRRCYPASFYK